MEGFVVVVFVMKTALALHGLESGTAVLLLWFSAAYIHLYMVNLLFY